MRTAQRGAALLVVLWACTLLAILLGGLATLVHLESEQARYAVEATRAHYAAEAGVMRAIEGLMVTRRGAITPGQATGGWRFDGWPYTFNDDGVRVTVAVTDERGKMDINSASPSLLQGLFQVEGLAAPQAAALAREVVAWRSRQGNPLEQQRERAAYQAAGRDYGPRNGRFASIEELAMVLGMSPELYAKLEPLVTLWSRQAMPTPSLAPLPVLAAMPGVGPVRASQYYAQRMQNPAGNASLGGGGGLDTSGAGSAWQRQPGSVVSIRAEAVLADGVKSSMQVTVRLEQQSQSLPYQVLRWQEGVGL